MTDAPVRSEQGEPYVVDQPQVCPACGTEYQRIYYFRDRDPGKHMVWLCGVCLVELVESDKEWELVETEYEDGSRTWEWKEKPNG